MVEVRELNVNQIEEIKSLFAEIFTNEPWNDDWSNPEQLHAYIMDLIGNRNSLSLGLSLGSIIHWCTGTEYYIFEFCIKTDRQGNGLGTEFLRHVEEYAKKKQATHIFLQTERTVPAYDFYQKNGFVDLKEHASLVKNFS